MPHVNFQRMTASAVGRHWRTATPEQQKRLQDEFKILIVRTYAGALTQVKEQTTVQLKPLRAAAEDTEVVVRTEVKGKGDPVQLDYRLEKSGTEWKIYDVNVLGVWLVETVPVQLRAGDRQRRRRRPDHQAGRAQQGCGQQDLIVCHAGLARDVDPGPGQ